VIATTQSNILIWTPEKSQSISITTEDPVSHLHIASIDDDDQVYIFAATTGGELIYSLAEDFTPIQMFAPLAAPVSLYQIDDTVLFVNDMFVNLIEFDSGKVFTAREIASPYILFP
jgi:hypothetical protein